MEMMKRMITTAAAAFICLAAFSQENPEGSQTYSLPQTVLTFDVEAVKESFFAGPYARYAEKYLGIQAKQQDATSFQLASVSLTPRIEADPRQRFTVFLPEGSGSNFLKLTAQGLVSVSDGSFGDESVWRFPVKVDGDFAANGVSSNFTSESSTLIRTVKADSVFNQVAVSQDIVVAKSLEQKAREAADMILSLRKTRIQIITGDTDASYSGEAMGAAIDEIARLEKEYLTLFTGYSEYQVQKMIFDLVPTSETRNNVFVAFRLSDVNGLVSADDLSGKPYLVDIIPEDLTAPAPQSGKAAGKGIAIRYRIPAVCAVKLSDGVNILSQTRVPVYQYGTTGTYYLTK